MGNVFTIDQAISNNEIKKLIGQKLKMSYMPPSYYLFGDDDIDEQPSRIHVITEHGTHYYNYLYNDAELLEIDDQIREPSTLPHDILTIKNARLVKEYIHTPGCFWGVYTDVKYKYIFETDHGKIALNTQLYNFIN